jgi:oligopeptidase B
MTAVLGLGAQSPVPPVAKQVEHIALWHGEKVPDPWFWLREKANPEVAAYLEAENAYTETMTAGLKPFSEALYKEMLGRIKQTDLSVPTRQGAYFYYSRTEEGKQYAIQCRRKAGVKGLYDDKAPEEIILDQNELAKGLKFLSLGGFNVSNDDRTLLFSTDATGFRQYTLFTRDLATGHISAPLAERVTSFTWAGDLRHVLFATEDAVTKRSNQVWRLDLQGGKPELVFEEKDELFGVSVERTRDKAFLLISCFSTDTWEQRLLPAATPTGAFKVVLPRQKGHKYSVDHREHLFYIRTNKDAKNFRLATAPEADPSEKNWKPFLAHDPKVLLQGIDLFRHFGVLSTQSEGLEHLRVIDFRTGKWRELSFPEPVYLAYPAGNPEYDTNLYRFSYQSMITPPSVYDCALDTLDRTLLKQTEVLGGYDKTQYATERLWATARDGVKVPLSVVYRKDVRRDGTAPLFLYGYGSYGAGMSPGCTHDWYMNPPSGALISTGSMS